MSWFCSGGTGEGRQWGEGVSLSPAYITKLRFIFKQNPKGLLEGLNLFQTMTSLDKNTNTMPLCSLYYNSDLFYFLNVTPCYNTKCILSSYPLLSLSQLRITLFYSREAPSVPPSGLWTDSWDNQPKRALRECNCYWLIIFYLCNSSNLPLV